MKKTTAENHYSIVAKKAYQNILKYELIDFQEAWNLATKEVGTKDSIKRKSCPQQTFIGLCKSGDLKGIEANVKCENINYQYAKFAIGEIRKDSELSNRKIWDYVYEKFKRAKNHNGQLYVVRGLLDVIK